MIVYFIIAWEQAVHDREVNFYMFNTGWAGGHYGTGSRIKLANTSAMVNAVLERKLMGGDIRCCSKMLSSVKNLIKQLDCLSCGGKRTIAALQVINGKP